MRSLAILLVGLTACGGARPQAPREVMTGDPLPDEPVTSAACAGAGFRWLASQPHTPLAISGPDGIASAEACCSAWARAGDTWTAVDAWGAPLGSHEITGGEGYDVSQCYELAFEGDDGIAQDGEDSPPLRVQGDQPWSAPPSARWIPDDAERAALLQLGAGLELALTPPPGREPGPQVRPLAERVAFFTMPGDPGWPDIPIHFAAIGGRALVIAGLDGTGTWRIHHIDAGWGLSAGPWPAEPYRIRAVFDLDGDGFPEVIVHRSDGPSWDDAILRCSQGSQRLWELVAESVGGSTA